MAVFTAIATAIVGAIGITGVLATIATSVIAGGLAYGTARALGVFKAPELDQGRDPGVSIQLPPATDNKIPILYGQAFTSGPIFDAAISNQNKTMTYCIALSEQTQTGTFTCDQVFMNDVELIFTGNTVTSHKDPNQSSDTSYAGNVRLNVYAGGSGSGDVIFPTSGTGSTTAATSIVPHWGANHTANALVFAVLQIDYDAENGLTGLPQMTFKMNNTLNNPGDVLYDYLTSTRYGAKLSNAEIDVNSITGTSNVEMKGYCDELVAYTNKANVSTTNKRYQINGMLSTFDSCSTNIDKICQASATFFTFNVKEGKFAAIPNRAISTAEKANCLVYNDDNIVSKIDISSTELYALYNGVEIEFMDQNRKDQTNTVLVETPAGDRNANEPDNVLKYKIDMINDNVRAERLANIDLNQSRVGTVIQFDADYSGIQTDVGDVIKVTNNLYGWTDKLFRVMRVTEISSDTGIVTARISAIEYSDDYYTNPASTETPDLGVIDLPRIPVIKDIPIVKAFQGSYSNVAALPNVYGDIIPNQAMKVFGAGAQLTDQPGPNTSIVSGTTFLDIIPEESYDITDSDIGDYEFVASAGAGGVLASAYDVGFRNKITLTFANATASNVITITGGGTELINMPSTTPPPPLNSTAKISTDPTVYGYASDMKPQTANITLQGYSDLGTSNASPRSFALLNYEFLRVTKGEKF
jgi:hypothetical protein